MAQKKKAPKAPKIEAPAEAVVEEKTPDFEAADEAIAEHKAKHPELYDAEGKLIEVVEAAPVEKPAKAVKPATSKKVVKKPKVVEGGSTYEKVFVIPAIDYFAKDHDHTAAKNFTIREALGSGWRATDEVRFVGSEAIEGRRPQVRLRYEVPVVAAS